MNVNELMAIDVHAHAEVSCRLKDFEQAGFKPEVRPLILKDNAVKLLGLAG